MKKNRITSALLALTLITTAASMHGAEEISPEEESTFTSPAAQEGQERSAITLAKKKVKPKISFKEKAKKQFSESLDRFKRCLKGKCTKWELADVGRDLIIAITALNIAYKTAKALQWARSIPSWPTVGRLYNYEGQVVILEAVERRLNEMPWVSRVHYATRTGDSETASLADWSKKAKRRYW